MKSKILVLAIVLSAFSINIKAQLPNPFTMVGFGDTGAKSLNIGFSPIGAMKVKLTEKKKGDEDFEGGNFKYHYKEEFSFSIGYERNSGLSDDDGDKVTTLIELLYSKGKFDKYDLKGEYHGFNPIQEDNIYNIGLTYYLGKTLNQGKRFQVPLLFGPSLDYVNSGAIHNLTIGVALKARLKFYITDGFGIFAGAGLHHGLYGRKKNHNNGYEDYSYRISPTLYNIDAGIAIRLK